MDIADMSLGMDDKLRTVEALLKGVIEHIEKMPVSNLEIALSCVRDVRRTLGVSKLRPFVVEEPK